MNNILIDDPSENPKYHQMVESGEMGSEFMRLVGGKPYYPITLRWHMCHSVVALVGMLWNPGTEPEPLEELGIPRSQNCLRSGIRLVINGEPECYGRSFEFTPKGNLVNCGEVLTPTPDASGTIVIDPRPHPECRFYSVEPHPRMDPLPAVLFNFAFRTILAAGEEGIPIGKDDADWDIARGYE